MKEWHYEEWLKLTHSNEELIFTIDSPRIIYDDHIVLRVYGKWNILKLEYVLLNALRQDEVVPLNQEQMLENDMIFTYHWRRRNENLNRRDNFVAENDMLDQSSVVGSRHPREKFN